MLFHLICWNAFVTIVLNQLIAFLSLASWNFNNLPQVGCIFLQFYVYVGLVLNRTAATASPTGVY